MISSLEEILPKISELEEFNIPCNDNLKDVIPENLNMFNGNLWTRVKKMMKGSIYRDKIDNLIVGIMASEDIPKYIIREANEKIVGFVGTDFLINDLYGFPSFGFKIGEDYADPCKVIKDDLNVGERLEFKGDDGGNKVIEAIIMKQNTKPRLCLLGPGDQEYPEFKRELKRRDEKTRVVVERRYWNIAKAFLENEFGDGYSLDWVTRRTERFIKSSKDDNTKRLYDIGIDIGETFSTAKANGLKEYKYIMQTYLAFIRCKRI